MERGQSLVHALDEALVDHDRDVRAVERGVDRDFVLPRLREEFVGLHLPVQRRAVRALELAELVEERLHDLLAIVAVRHERYRL
jgi:hypothetical protein